MGRSWDPLEFKKKKKWKRLMHTFEYQIQMGILCGDNQSVSSADAAPR